MYYRGAVGIILVYDVSEPQSFQNLDYWIKRVQEHVEKDAEIILIGNKIDKINEILVDQENAAQLAQRSDIAYFQTSAKDSTNIEIAFKHLLTQIMNKEALREKIDYKANVRLHSTKTY